MWKVKNVDLQMTEGDWGVELPITFNGITLGAQDSIKLTIKTAKNGEEIVTKDFSDIAGNTINLELDEVDSAKLPVGVYCYLIDWYQAGSFLCNLVESASFKVVDKA